jgi:CheY-like chemotaxis protein
MKTGLIIMDIMMPNFGTGVEAYKKIRLEKNLTETPVIFLTGLKPSEAEPMMPRNDRRVRILYKPAKRDKLLDTIEFMTAGALRSKETKTDGPPLA